MSEISDDTLATLLKGVEEKDRIRLKVAWERHAKGDPDSLPALYALADRFSILAHAALLERQEELLNQFPRLIEEAKSKAPSGFPDSRKASSRGLLVWVVFASLAAGALGGFLLKPNQTADMDFVSMIRRSGAEITHYETRAKDGGTLHVIELSSSGKPKAYLTREGNAAIVYPEK